MRSKVTCATVLLLTMACGVCAQSGSVSNAADAPAYGGFASGITFAIPSKPPSLAPRSLANIQYFSSVNSSRPLAGAAVSVRPVGSSNPIPATVVSASSDSITFEVPPETPSGPAQLIYRAPPDTTRWIEVTVVPQSFELFRKGAPGPPLAQQIDADGKPVSNGLATPARPGQAVVLWGSGLGATPPSNVSVTLGGVAQKIQYAGAAPSLRGVDQINFQVASGTPSGCYVPLVVNYGDQAATSYLSVTSDGGPCKHPLQLSKKDLTALDSGGALAVGVISTQSKLQIVTADHASRLETAAVSFQSWGAAQLAGSYVTQPANGCVAPAGSGTWTETASFVFDALGGNYGVGDSALSNGATHLTLSPLQGTSLPASDTGLSGLPPAVLAGPNWVWSSSGGSMLVPSSFGFSLPSPIAVSGGVPVTWARDQNPTVSWNGTSYDAAAVVTVTVTGAGPSAPVLLTCSAAANAGALTIPKNLLSGIDPVTAALTTTVMDPFAASGFAQFALQNGSTLLMTVNAITSDSRPLDIQ